MTDFMQVETSKVIECIPMRAHIHDVGSYWLVG